MPRRRFFSDMPDKGLFALISLLGFVGIIVLKTRTAWSSELVAALAVAIMLLYGFVVYQMPEVRMRPDRLGEISTILVLSTLWQAFLRRYCSCATPLRSKSSSVIFVLPLITMVSVAGRVLFVQMRGELDEVEDRVRRDLVTASADLRAQLTLSLTEFETFRTATLQASREAVEAAGNKASGSFDQIGILADFAAKAINATFLANQSNARVSLNGLPRLSTRSGSCPHWVRSSFPVSGSRSSSPLLPRRSRS